MVLRLLGLLLLIWLAITVIGWVVEGLFWLALVGLAAFLVTAAIGTRRSIHR